MPAGVDDGDHGRAAARRPPSAISSVYGVRPLAATATSDVGGGDRERCQVVLGQGQVVLVAVGAVGAAGDPALHLAAGQAEGARQLGGLGHGQAARRAGPDEQQPPAGPHPVGDQLGGRRRSRPSGPARLARPAPRPTATARRRPRWAAGPARVDRSLAHRPAAEPPRAAGAARRRGCGWSRGRGPSVGQPTSTTTASPCRRAASSTAACQACRAGSRTTTTRVRPTARAASPSTAVGIEALGHGPGLGARHQLGQAVRPATRAARPTPYRRAAGTPRRGARRSGGSRPMTSRQREPRPARTARVTADGGVAEAGQSRRTPRSVFESFAAQPAGRQRRGHSGRDVIDQRRVVLGAALDGVRAGDQRLDEAVDHADRARTRPASPARRSRRSR